MTVLRKVNVLGLAAGVAILLVWEILKRTGVIDIEYLPMPSQIAVGAWGIVENGDLVTYVGHTLTAALTGWAVAVVVGIPLGTVIGLVRPVWKWTMASVDSLRALPIVAFVPVAVLLFGFSMQTEILVAAYAALWPITLNTISGMRSLDKRKQEVGEVLKLSAAHRLWKLRLPAATPSIVVGMRLGLAISLVLTLVAEMVGNPAGLGFALLQAGQALRPERMFAYIVAIGLIGILLNTLLQSGARVLFRGQMTAAGDHA